MSVTEVTNEIKKITVDEVIKEIKSKTYSDNAVERYGKEFDTEYSVYDKHEQKILELMKKLHGRKTNYHEIVEFCGYSLWFYNGHIPDYNRFRILINYIFSKINHHYQIRYSTYQKIKDNDPDRKNYYLEFEYRPGFRYFGYKIKEDECIYELPFMKT